MLNDLDILVFNNIRISVQKMFTFFMRFEISNIFIQNILKHLPLALIIT